MPAIVSREDPGALSAATVRSGDPIRGALWAPVGSALGFALGSPRTLIPWCSPDWVLRSTDGTQTLSFRAFPSIQATHRMWNVVLADTAEDEFASGVVTFTNPSGGSSTLNLDSGARVLTHVETVVLRTNAESTLSVTVSLSKGFCLVAGISCVELPRRELAVDVIDLGIESASLVGGAPILGGVTGHSLGAIPDALSAALVRGRRHLVQWARPETTADAWSTASASYVDTPVAGLEILERHLYAGDAAGVDGTARVRAWVSGGTGDVQIVTSDGAVSVAVSATTPTWHTLTPDIAAEDMSAADGRRGGVDLLTVQARKSGGGTLYIAGIGVFGRGS